jgi:ubiquinone/menaquinone biosynthesis C-methylase UbiE
MSYCHHLLMDTQRATSFGSWADEYDVSRPTYPTVAVDWLVPPGARFVVEAGAGTGKLTDRLVERGDLELDVTEIDGRMLEIISKRYPELRTHETGVSALPVGDASVDAVLVADAWHWFPKAEAAAEVTRVLRPGGWLGCMWNDMVPTGDWQWKAVRLDPAIAASIESRSPRDRLGLTFGHAVQQRFRWTWMLTPEQWRSYVATVSHVRTLPEDECRAALDDTERLAAEACTAAGECVVPLVYDAVCVRWQPTA